MSIKVNYGKSVHGKEEIKAVSDTIRNSTQMGKQTKKFENENKTQAQGTVQKDLLLD